MIEKSELTKVIETALEGSELFLVDVAVSRDNNIVVEIDSMDCVSIDDCAKLTKAIESHFDRDVEDYELEVGSAGLTSPFKVKRQYEKYIDEEVEILTKDGRKLKGTLKDATDDNFTVSITKKVKPEGAKRPVEVTEDETFNYDEIKYTKYLIQFK
ncbi:MAG: ribosome assembly cofactor RimP [Muribaculaceae bacterium]|mgnify:FL=1|jgi:ribosome maturation factor RimP|nr:ribosome assembly cofactor RimP [Muribaculaceae bacterium]MEE1337980.1 ribosome assembly cofactor RimP [Muribaculaceae bacterium]